MADAIPFLFVDRDGDRVRIAYGQALMFVRLVDLPALVDELGEYLPEAKLVGPLASVAD